MDNDTTPDMSDLQAYAGPSTTSDRVKNVLEMFFCQQIIWWPLAEPIRPLKSGMTRYVVKCTDQCTDYIDLPILSERPVMPFPRHQVSQRRRTVLHTSTLSTDPRAGETAIGPGPSSSLQSPPLARSSRLTATGQTPATNSATSHQIISIAPGKKAQKPGSWIYWCVTGRDKNYKVVDINAAKTVSTPQTQQTLITAAELSRQLLFHYRKHTRWLVRLMTISWCASGILSEFIYIGVGANDDITPTAICRPSKEPPTLPDALEYDYEKFSHTPGFDVQKAYLQGAIRHYMVEHVRFQWPRRFGDPITCTPDDNGLCDMAKFVDRIPKKSPLSVPKAQGEGAYCLEARTELSFFKAVCLLFLSTLGCVIFAIVYMKQHPDDWEKGVVPLTLVLAGVPVYLGLIVLWKANVS
ncbi:uncharacterized protein HMPREF1541_06127 [Cyphellophora europaea CBS 101466]|uniref:Uncharacterized protein n=1 Tax=Cyphellophora europaea (strain CBS 101466) TaxID=1220924 RepID=W2RTU1_CYPE1|nr:uncharacterized protein HMPREF1541_06127 [Cyphellophora europaea CBS 101466]ETN39901.1 hypothetical protein HMPREF1541_06127 [Cyphellophora europaea CBS 101466]